MSTEDAGLQDEVERLGLPKLPHGWCWSRTGDVGAVRLGRQRSPQNRSDKFPTKYMRAANITWKGIDLSDVLDMEFTPAEQDVYRLLTGDVILAEASGSPDEVGKPAIWRGELENCCFQNTVIRFRSAITSPRYAHIIFSYFARNSVFARAAKGVSINHLSAARFATLPFPLAPRPEQERIANKVEQLFSDLDAGVAALKRAKANLKRYRAAVLKAAVEGKLTAEWRAKHPPKEPASKLLERILTERRTKWEHDQLAAYEAKGKQPPKNWRDRYQEPAGPDTAALPALPEGWCWATVQQLLIECSANGISVKGGNSPPGVPALRLSAMSTAGFNYQDRRYIPISKEIADKLSIMAGDFFVSRGNGSLHLVGRGTLAQKPPERIVFPDTMIRLRFLTYPWLRRYLAIIWESRHVRKQIERRARTTAGIYKISQTDIDHFLIPLPPTDEQRTIVESVDALVSVVDQVACQIQRQLARSTRLRQSILKRAFEGKLVPQDPTDEPATLLVGRTAGEDTEASVQQGKRETNHNRKRRKAAGR